MTTRLLICMFASLLLAGCKAPASDTSAPTEHVRYSDAAAAQQQAQDTDAEATTPPAQNDGTH